MRQASIDAVSGMTLADLLRPEAVAGGKAAQL
jgi:hypothetical protein